MKFWLVVQLVLLKTLGLVLMFATEWMLLGGGIFLAGGFWVMAHHFLPRAQGLCDVVTGFEAEGRDVWLTIDDGPDPEDTPKILEALQRHDAKATFFMIGARAERYPELVRQVVAAGHSVGCHTYSHPKAFFWCAGPRRVARELDRCLAVLKAAGADVRLYRSPVGIKNIFLRRCLRERDLRCVAWTLRSGDGLGKQRDAIVGRVLNDVRPGSIILMHEGPTVAPAVRVAAIEGVLRGLSERGVRCVVPAE